MPYVALLDGQSIDASLIFDPRQWAELTGGRRRDLTMPCCGGRARACTSSVGTHFFAHLPSSGCSEVINDYPGESPLHRLLKRAILHHLGGLPGWTADMEHRGSDRAYVADVAARHAGGRRMAVEVQLSRQSVDMYRIRSERYLQRRILPVWITRGRPTALTVWWLPHLNLPESISETLSISDALALPGTTQQWRDGRISTTLIDYLTEMANPDKEWPWSRELEPLPLPSPLPRAPHVRGCVCEPCRDGRSGGRTPAVIIAEWRARSRRGSPESAQ